MENNNEYERLVKQGYIEEGTLLIQVDDITKMQLTSEQVKSEVSKQGFRQDKGVVIIDKQGNMKKVSSLMFGYNKNNVQLADGSFANSDDLLLAMKKAINSLDSGTIIIDKKGKVLNPDELLKVVEETAGKIKIGHRSNSITNQDSRHWSVEGANSDVEHKKGVVFLGNNGIDLKTGDYISVDELITALNNYVIMKPSQEQTTTEKKDQPLIVRVTHKYKNKLSRWLALLAALMVLFSGIRIKDNVKALEVPVEYQDKIVQLVEQDQLNYIINGIDYEFTYETLEEAQRRIASEYKMGDEVQLHDGDTLYENSELGGRKVVIGQGIRQSGNYQISGVSIVYKGNMYKWHVDTSIKNPGFEIGKFINETCTKYNLDLNLVEIRLHLGNSANYTRTGWIDISKLIKEDTIDKQATTKQEVINSTHSGVIDNFNGSTITIDGVNGPVTINVIGSDGNLLQPGTIVIGSDGQEYKIGNLQIDSALVEKEIIETVTVMEKKQVVAGKKLTWSIQDCSLAIAIAPIVGAIAASVATKKKNEEAQENPKLFEFNNEQEYLEFKSKFEEAKEKYEKESNFKKIIKKVFYRKEVDLLQRLTPEQVQQLYSIIINWNDSNYSYSTNDKIEFKNGRIIVSTIDGQTKDITEIIMSSISKIGKENDFVAEGLLENTEKDEIHQR